MGGGSIFAGKLLEKFLVQLQTLILEILMNLSFEIGVSQKSNRAHPCSARSGYGAGLARPTVRDDQALCQQCPLRALKPRLQDVSLSWLASYVDAGFILEIFVLNVRVGFQIFHVVFIRIDGTCARRATGDPVAGSLGFGNCMFKLMTRRSRTRESYTRVQGLRPSPRGSR